MASEPRAPSPTHLLVVDRDSPDPAAIADAADTLRAGGLVAFATETVYGLGADATNSAAIERIFQAKGRPATNPLIVHLDTIERARSCVSTWPPAAQVLAERFWPGPLTLVLPRSAQISKVVTAGLETVGVRIPGTPVARLLITRTDRPLAAPSANRSAGLSPTLAQHVLKDLEGKIDLILDSGPTQIGLESTVLDLSSQPPRVLRPGAISAEDLSATIGAEVAVAQRFADVGSALTSPGQMEVHYAPRTRTVRVEVHRLASVGWPERAALLVVGWPDCTSVCGPLFRVDLSTPSEAARALYETLHRWDELGLEQIVIVPPPDRPEWRAVRDRILRAALPMSI
jgi:L-threonylcarbamoyladenylate synthase